MQFVDTHCHPQFNDFLPNPEAIVTRANSVGVTRLIAVGTTLVDSAKALQFAAEHNNVWASVGVHPHDAADFTSNPEFLRKLNKLSIAPKVVALGEIGLDYYRNYSPKEKQQQALRDQIEIGLKHNLPFVFHVRDALPTGRQAWEDFWPILDSYKNLKGVVHSFSAHKQQLEQALQRDLYIGLNGIMTFTKDSLQLEAAQAVPTDKLLLETDAPFLAPEPFRGQTCEPKHLVHTAKFLADIRGQSLEELAKASTENALKLFKLENQQ